jgi:hypothetical protein
VISIEDDAYELVRLGASQQQLKEMREALEFVVSGIRRRRGQWIIEPRVERFVAGNPPELIRRRLLIGLHVIAKAEALVQEIEASAR